MTHRGNVRKQNEDSIFASPEMGLWLVADGMGGHSDGKMASSMIAEAAGRIAAVAPLEALATALLGQLAQVNAQLLAHAEANGNVVGSTIVALLIGGGEYRCLWAGDSRCYLVRGGHIRQISRDHTEVQELVDRQVITPAEAKSWPRRNVITRAIGAQPDAGIEQAAGSLRHGDCFLLCSDGLTAHVEDDEILAVVSRLPVEAACETLLALALQRGGKDNISVIVVKVDANEATVVVKR
jgi:protein phosphatase